MHKFMVLQHIFISYYYEILYFITQCWVIQTHHILDFSNVKILKVFFVAADSITPAAMLQ